ncbi:hypothetical protein B0H14DRAFT_3459733 [Mycena olivaceomarginata]|nr:hypothetical protein B0H14DRAFT_3459733 [Mycena olivaceomarginata]
MSSTQHRLVTVNTVPERAKRLIGRVVEDVKDRYTIVHVANVESPVGRLCRHRLTKADGDQHCLPT